MRHAVNNTVDITWTPLQSRMTPPAHALTKVTFSCQRAFQLLYRGSRSSAVRSSDASSRHLENA